MNPLVEFCCRVLFCVKRCTARAAHGFPDDRLIFVETVSHSVQRNRDTDRFVGIGLRDW